jgi:hypothetical protein
MSNLLFSFIQVERGVNFTKHFKGAQAAEVREPLL